MRPCATCLWFRPRATSLTRNVGDCRRKAPTGARLGQGWPGVFAVDGCGEHDLDETKLPPPRRQDVPTPPPVWDDPEEGGLPVLPPHDPASCRFCQDEATAVPFAPED